jgi:hypothetical protein
MRTYASYSVGMGSLTGAVASSYLVPWPRSGSPAAGGTKPHAVITMKS